MKKLLLLFFSVIVSAQNTTSELQNIANSERKAASKIINFQPNANTENYDLTYQKLEFTLNPSIKFISGKITSTYTALSAMSVLTFDMANELTVSSVKKNGVDLIFSESGNNELLITLPTTQAIGTSATVEVTYSGTPPNNGFSAFVKSTHAGVPIIWTLSEPFGARDWWPCKQDLIDKINNIDVYITSDSQYVSVSNGLQQGLESNPDGTNTTHFKHNYPIPAYLIAIAVTNYSVINQMAGTAPNQFPIVNYVYPETVTPALNTQLNQTPLIMNLFENLFETYPFAAEKYGHAQFGWGGGMEHTTVSFMSNFSRGLIAHELAHQWFGDKITCGSWKDIWLNEGFATYCNTLVIENFDGQAAFIADKISMINAITAQPSGALYLNDTEVESVNRIFDYRLSYQKGAMVLNMLRLKMGSTNFFQGIKNYLADVNLAYKYAITPQLQSHLEIVYGSSLTEFFNDWVYGSGYPTYNITGQNFGTGLARFKILQTQSDASVSYFEMPIPIRIFGANGQQLDVVLNNTSNNQFLIANVPFVMTSFSFDPKKDIISKNNTVTLGNINQELELSSLYPNPTTGILSLSGNENLGETTSIFYNAIGQKMLQTTNVFSWNVSDFASGIYFIKLKTEKGEKQLRFVKN